MTTPGECEVISVESTAWVSHTLSQTNMLRLSTTLFMI